MALRVTRSRRIPPAISRLTAGTLNPLVVTFNSILWTLTLGGPDNLLSAMVLRGVALDAMFGAGVLALGPTTLLRSPTVYFLANEVSNFDGPCGTLSVSCLVNTNYRANVSVYEQNAVWTLSNQNANPTITPEPGTLTLLAAGMLTVLILRRRRHAKRAVERHAGCEPSNAAG